MLNLESAVVRIMVNLAEIRLKYCEIVRLKTPVRVKQKHRPEEDFDKQEMKIEYVEESDLPLTSWICIFIDSHIQLMRSKDAIHIYRWLVTCHTFCHGVPIMSTKPNG